MITCDLKKLWTPVYIFTANDQCRTMGIYKLLPSTTYGNGNCSILFIIYEDIV